MHQQLLSKLEVNGICRKLLNWIRAFLIGRRHRAVMQGSRSGWSPVTSGIPQGSVLRPTLFTIFANDMPRHVELERRVKLFADDTKLYSCAPAGRDSAPQPGSDSLERWAEK